MACGAYAVLSVPLHQPFHPTGSLGYFDLKVYRGAAHLLVGGDTIYGRKIYSWAPFTYPPFAALTFTPLALVPIAVAEAIVTALSLAALVGVVFFALRLPPGELNRESSHGQGAWLMLAIGVAGALWLEPVTTTLGFGQISVVLALLILADLSRPETARTKGALIGIAAGLKLTPLIFVPYLLLSRRFRAAFVALVAFAATIMLAFAIAPADASRYWGHLFLESKHVGGCCTPSNQSLRGAILALNPSFSAAPLIGLSAIVGVVGITLAVRASRRGDEAMGFSLCALTGLLASPVSWTHHWVLAAPALLIFAARAYRRRSMRGLAISAGLLLVGYSYLPALLHETYVHGWAVPLRWALVSDSYVLIGIAALAVAWRHEVMHFSARRKSDGTAPAGNTPLHARFESCSQGQSSRDLAPSDVS